MGLSTWLKENRLQRLHTKLKRLRAAQSRVRDQIEDLHKEKRRTGDAALDAREAKLQAERERITHEINELVGQEDALKAELKAAGIAIAR